MTRSIVDHYHVGQSYHRPHRKSASRQSAPFRMPHEKAAPGKTNWSTLENACCTTTAGILTDLSKLAKSFETFQGSWLHNFIHILNDDGHQNFIRTLPTRTRCFFSKDAEGLHMKTFTKLHSEKAEEDPSQPLHEGGNQSYVSSLENVGIASILYPGDFWGEVVWSAVVVWY